MDWDGKEFAWDPRGLELANGEGQRNEAASVDLRLGEEKSVPEVAKDPRDSKTVSSPSGSSKRSRLQNGSQNMCCSVDGCSSDLSDCREYHRRHRVCEKHSKTPVVLVGGKQQRFCQQCSRYGLEFGYVGVGDLGIGMCSLLMFGLMCFVTWGVDNCCVGFTHLGSLMKLRGVVGKGLMGITGAGGNLSLPLFSWLLRNSCTITKVCAKRAFCLLLLNWSQLCD